MDQPVQRPLVMKETSDVKQSIIMQRLKDQFATIERNDDRISQQIDELIEGVEHCRKTVRNTQILNYVLAALILYLPIWFLDRIFDIAKQLP